MNIFKLSIVCLLFLSIFISDFTQSQLGDTGNPELVRKENCEECAAKVRYIFDLNKTDKSVRVAIESITQVKKYFCSLGCKNLIIWGEAPYGGDILQITDSSNVEKKIELWGYGMTFSNDNKYVLYNNWYPRMGSEVPRYVVLFDLDGSIESAAIRGSSVSGADSLGLFVYPIENLPGSGVPEGIDFEGALANSVKWIGDKLVFSSTIKGFTSLFLVNLGEGGETQSCVIPLMRHQDEESGSSPKQRNRKNVVENISIDEENNLVVELFDQGYMQTRFTIRYRSYCAF